MGIAENTVKRKNEIMKACNITVDYLDLGNGSYTYTITLDQLIEPQMRPRTSPRGLYDPLAKYKNILKNKVLKEINDKKIPLFIAEEGYHLTAEIELISTPPASWPINKQINALYGDVPFNKKPDIDNCVKCIYDTFEKVFFYNDSQIIKETLHKHYGLKESTKIILNVFKNKELEKYGITKRNIDNSSLDKNIKDFIKGRMK